MPLASRLNVCVRETDKSRTNVKHDVIKVTNKRGDDTHKEPRLRTICIQLERKNCSWYFCLSFFYSFVFSSNDKHECK